jgi:hypothetical protein
MGRAGAAAVVDHDLLAEAVAKVSRDQASHDIVAAARRKGNYHPHRPGRIILGGGRGDRASVMAATAAAASRQIAGAEGSLFTADLSRVLSIVIDTALQDNKGKHLQLGYG